MPDPIASLQNQRIKNAVKLRDRRAREKQGRMIIDGNREIQRALEAGINLVELFYSASLKKNDEFQQLMNLAEATGVEVLEVVPAVFAKLAFGHRSEEAVAVAETPSARLAKISLPAAPLVAVLEGIEKPGNVGAILRSADAAGLSAVIVVDGGTDLYNPNTIRASLGAIFTMPVFVAESTEAVAWLSEHGFQIVTARVDAEMDYAAADYRSATAIVLGSESAGLSEIWSGRLVRSVRLPMRGVVDSLNVSATAAVLFYQAIQQREKDFR